MKDTFELIQQSKVLDRDARHASNLLLIINVCELYLLVYTSKYNLICWYLKCDKKFVTSFLSQIL